MAVGGYINYLELKSGLVTVPWNRHWTWKKVDIKKVVPFKELLFSK